MCTNTVNSVSPVGFNFESFWTGLSGLAEQWLCFSSLRDVRVNGFLFWKNIIELKSRIGTADVRDEHYAYLRMICTITYTWEHLCKHCYQSCQTKNITEHRIIPPTEFGFRPFSEVLRYKIHGFKITNISTGALTNARYPMLSLRRIIVQQATI